MRFHDLALGKADTCGPGSAVEPPSAVSRDQPHEMMRAPDWLAEGRQSRFYGIAIPAAVAMLLFLGR